MKKRTGRKLSLKRESLTTLENQDQSLVQGGTFTANPCYPFSYPKSACPGDTCI